jgi:predicted nuclease with TOPRIM domain
LKEALQHAEEDAKTKQAEFAADLEKLHAVQLALVAQQSGADDVTKRLADSESQLSDLKRTLAELTQDRDQSKQRYEDEHEKVIKTMKANSELMEKLRQAATDDTRLRERVDELTTALTTVEAKLVTVRTDAETQQKVSPQYTNNCHSSNVIQIIINFQSVH